MRRPRRRELSELRTLSEGFARSARAKEIVEAVKRGLARDPKTVPALRTGMPLPAEKVALLDLLRVLLKGCAARHKVAPRLIADGDDLERIAVEDHPDVPAMKGWRYDLFGKLAEQLKRGELALKVVNGEVVAFALATTKEAPRARVTTRADRLSSRRPAPKHSSLSIPQQLELTGRHMVGVGGLPRDGIGADGADDGDKQRQHQHPRNDHHSHRQIHCLSAHCSGALPIEASWAASAALIAQPSEVRSRREAYGPGGARRKGSVTGP